MALRILREQDAACDARGGQGVCAVRTFEGCRRTDVLVYIREDDMLSFVLGLFNDDMPGWLWLLLILWEVFVYAMIGACMYAIPITG